MEWLIRLEEIRDAILMQILSNSSKHPAKWFSSLMRINDVNFTKIVRSKNFLRIILTVILPRNRKFRSAPIFNIVRRCDTIADPARQIGWTSAKDRPLRNRATLAKCRRANSRRASNQSCLCHGWDAIAQNSVRAKDCRGTFLTEVKAR